MKLLTLLLSLMRLAAMLLLAFLAALLGSLGASTLVPRCSREESAPEWRGRRRWLPPQTTITRCSLSLAFSLTASTLEQLLWSHVSSTQGLSREHQGDSDVQEELLPGPTTRERVAVVWSTVRGSAQERDVTKARSSASWLWHSCTPTSYETHTADCDLCPRLPLLHL